VVRLAPPLVIERAQVDEAVNALRRVLQAIDAKAGVRGRAVVA
jgi:ornithine--oxo-acid transaminase